MDLSRFDFGSLRPSMCGMRSTTRTGVQKETIVGDVENAQSVRSGADLFQTLGTTHGLSGADSISLFASRRRSSVTRPRTSVVHAVGSENLPQEKAQTSCPPSSVLGDATNTYASHRRPSLSDVSCVAKPKAMDHSLMSQSWTSLELSGTGEGEVDGIAAQHSNPQHVAEYAPEIFQLLKAEELQTAVSPGQIERQTHVNPKMRAILVDWLVDVHKKYKMRPETLFLAVHLLDAHLACQITAQRKLQLVGITAIMIAAKFEEVYPPQMKEFVHVCDKAYTKEDILQMEVQILSAVSFRVCAPTVMHFLDQYQSANGCSDSHRDLAQYLLELTLVDHKMLKYTPSHQAAAAILLSNKLLRKPSWTPAVAKLTKMTEPMLKECAKEMCTLLEGVETSSLQAVRRKFSQPKHHSVAKCNFMVGPGSQVAKSPSATTVRRSKCENSTTM